MVKWSNKPWIKEWTKQCYIEKGRSQVIWRRKKEVRLTSLPSPQAFLKLQLPSWYRLVAHCALPVLLPGTNAGSNNCRLISWVVCVVVGVCVIWSLELCLHLHSAGLSICCWSQFCFVVCFFVVFHFFSCHIHDSYTHGYLWTNSQASRRGSSYSLLMWAFHLLPAHSKKAFPRLS